MSNDRELPKGWSWSSLDAVCRKITDGTHHSPSQEMQTATGDYLYVTAKNIKERGVDLSNVAYVPETVHRPIYERCNPQEGDVLYIKDGVTTGVATVNQLTEEFSLLSSVALLKPRIEIIDPHFLKWFLNSPTGYDAMTAMMGGTAIKRLTLKKIKEGRVIVPPLPEQQRIVSKIEELFSDLDAGVSALERAKANLKRYRASVLKAAVEGRLTADWRAANPDIEPATELLHRILTTRRQTWEANQLAEYERKGKKPPAGWEGKYKEPNTIDVAKLPKLPIGWTWACVDQVGKVQLGRQRSPKHHSGPNMRPYLRVANVFEDRIDISDVMEMNFTPDEYETYKLEYGDILLNEGQSFELIGRPAMYRDEVPGACFTNTLVRFRAIGELDRDFALRVFLAYLKNGRFQKIASITVNIAHLGAGRFAELEFPLPPLDEQRKIVEVIDHHFSLIDASARIINASLLRAKRIRQSILKRAFEGRLMVTIE